MDVPVIWETMQGAAVYVASEDTPDMAFRAALAIAGTAQLVLGSR